MEAIYLENVDTVLKQVLKERQEDEKRFHTARVAHLMKEKLELEIRLAVCVDLLRHLEEWAIKSIDEAK